jgi:integrase/recombinase XerD
MTTPDAVPFPVLVSAASEQLRLAMAAYLSRHKGQSRVHAESDLRAYLTWCLERGADPLQVSRPQVELYVRWMQEIRRFEPSTVSRRLSVMVGFYRTCVIDGVLPSIRLPRRTLADWTPDAGDVDDWLARCARKGGGRRNTRGAASRS